MPAPKIKIYQLPNGYSAAADRDIQFRQGDELLPVAEKLPTLEDVHDLAVPLTGVKTYRDEPLEPVDITGGTLVLPLSPDGASLQNPAVDLETLVLSPLDGAFAPVVTDGDDIVIQRYRRGETLGEGDRRWRLTELGIEFLGVPPSDATLTCLGKPTEAATYGYWVVPGSTLYGGANSSWNAVRIKVDGGPSRIVVPTAYGSGQLIQITAGEITFSGAMVHAVAHEFIGEHPNWVVGHLRMWPDVFVGVTDYGGDSYTEIDPDGTINTITVGDRPAYREPSSYQLNAREGLIAFAEPIDSTATPVKANYAYLVGIANVTDQSLDGVGGSTTEFRAISETAFPGSHDRRWVGRDTALTPINVYVDGILTPQIQTVAPYEDLTVKTS